MTRAVCRLAPIVAIAATFGLAAPPEPPRLLEMEKEASRLLQRAVAAAEAGDGTERSRLLKEAARASKRSCPLRLPRVFPINSSRDALFELSGVRASFDKLAACYAKAGVPERVRTRLYDTPHEFNAEMQTEAWAWLARHLAT
jgi:hypothetical protein